MMEGVAAGSDNGGAIFEKNMHQDSPFGPSLVISMVYTELGDLLESGDI